MTFKELNISEPILRALSTKNYESPTPIQEKAIPAALRGEDILGIAQTGTGKTAAFAIPIIQQLDQPNGFAHRRDIKALILTPTRELAIQIGESFSEYSKFTNIRHTVIFGGVNQRNQVNQLRKGIDILVATPGRLLDLIHQNYISLKQVQHFVLDEADRMLDMGFIHDIKRLLPMLPKEKQTLFFSATMPTAIHKLSTSILNNPVTVKIKPVADTSDLIEQQLYYVERQKKNQLLVTLLREDRNKSVLVFSRTKRGADRIAKILKVNGIECEAIHGNKSQGRRQEVITNFKSGRTRVIVATDIAARGIDIANLELVINFDLPDMAETYIHRIGRTGRAGKNGTALSFCSQDEHLMVRNIQRLTGNKLNTVMAS